MVQVLVHVLALVGVLCVVLENSVCAEQVPLQEMIALHDLYNSTGGEHWRWQPLEPLSSRWDFTKDETTGDYLYSPCGGEDNVRWQGVICTNSSVSSLSVMLFNLTGSVPNSIGQLRNVTSLLFLTNDLTGTIPSSIGNMEKLWRLNFNYNSMTGTIPTFISSLPKLEYLYLSENYLTGTIPSELGNLDKSLSVLQFADNLLTGTIPYAMGRLTNLILFALDYNLLTGTIPPELSQLVLLEDIGISNCDFSGTIPPELGNLQSVLYFYLQSNLLTGTIPSQLGQLVNVNWFGLSFNRLTGTIPRELGNLLKLGDLYMDANMLTGTVPIEFNNFRSLGVLRLQRNLLTGELTGRLAGLNLLQSVDFSDNRLSGSIPDDVFDLPSLQTISLSLNCFSGELPNSMCAPLNISVFSLDGLGAARHCKNAVEVPLTGVVIDNTLRGTVPDCVWSLTSLQVLHITGNGLSGAISDINVESSPLESLSMSHNKFTGTIPTSMMGRSYLLFDISHNKITGIYDKAIFGRGSDSSVIMEVNRLSGNYPQQTVNSTAAEAELRVIRGNLFSCEYIPKEDEYNDEYICGSANLELSLYICLAAICSVVLFVVTLRYGMQKRNCFGLSNIGWLEADRQKYISCLDILVMNSAMVKFVHRIFNFTKELNIVMKMFLLLLLANIVSSLPFYCIKLMEYGSPDTIYTTHAYQYRWELSIAHVKGTVTALLLMLMWLFVLSCMVFFVLRDVSMNKMRREASVETSSQHSLSHCDNAEISSPKTSSLRSKAIYGLIFVLNGLVYGCVNGVYIYLSNQALSPQTMLGIQVAVAFFKISWNNVAVRVMANPFQTPVQRVGFELPLLVFNNILIPCIITAFTSPACFQGLLVAPDEVESQYQYTFCEFTRYDGNTTVCALESLRTVYVSPLRPPFLYNNQCTSTIIRSYVPVFLYVYSIQLIATVAMVGVLTSVDYLSVPSFVRQRLYGIYWPSHDWVPDRTLPRDMIKAGTIINFDILSHLAVFVTFGISSPYLAFVLTFVVCVKLHIWQIVVGRFVHYQQKRVNDGEFAAQSKRILSLVNWACIPVLKTISGNMKPIVLSSGLFYGFVCWDMVGDEVGWRMSAWVPTSVISISILLLILVAYFVNPGEISDVDYDGNIVLSSQQGRSQASTENPLQVFPSNEVELRLAK